MNPQASRILPEGTKLPHNYIIDNILGEGGFGITYSGHLTSSGEKVAIKEYFPSEISYRHTDSNTTNVVLPYTGSEISFNKGREHFRREASILKEFQYLHNIVSINDIIEANGTIYLVMEYIDGITLKQYIKENGVLSYDSLFELMTPIIQALIQIHKKGILHRDISPENIMVGTDNQFHLIDFGAASFENSHVTKTITVMLKSGYAPPEQYLPDGKQGPWTDIYALAATMYYGLTGITPTDSVRRMQTDDLASLNSLVPVISWQAEAIEKGMQLSAALRFRNMESFYQALRIPPIKQDSRYQTYPENSIEQDKTIMPYREEKKQPYFRSGTKPLLLVIAIIILGILLVGTKRISGYLAGNDKTSATTKDVEQKISKDTAVPSASHMDTTKPVSTTEKITEVKTTEGNTEATAPRDVQSSTSNIGDTTQNEAATEQTTQAPAKKPNYNVVPDDEDSYETIHLK